MAELDDEDKEMFLEELGIQESGLDLLIKATYSLLGYATYFTAGVQEVRAWTFRKGMKAPQCAAIIHTDFERGFIRAETVAYDDLVEAGSMVAAKETGKVRQEGKEYVVKDGDVILFRFNVINIKAICLKPVITGKQLFYSSGGYTYSRGNCGSSFISQSSGSFFNCLYIAKSPTAPPINRADKNNDYATADIKADKAGTIPVIQNGRRSAFRIARFVIS